jgi:sec-independent protein translocase protein TatC
MPPSGPESPDTSIDRQPDRVPFARPAERAGSEWSDLWGPGAGLLTRLDDLRRRLVRMALALVAGFLFAFAFIGPIVSFVLTPLNARLPPGSTMIYTEPAEFFLLEIKVAALVGAFAALPFLLWQIWGLIAPALGARAKRMAVAFVFFTTLLFLTGAAFAHYVVFPWAWRFFASFATDYMEFLPRSASTFSLYAKMILAFGLVFQLPTVVFFLARAGLVTHRTLIRQAKIATLLAFIVGAILTPPDVVSQVLLAGPIMGLYGVGILIAWVFGRRPDAGD